MVTSPQSAVGRDRCLVGDTVKSDRQGCWPDMNEVDELNSGAVEFEMCWVGRLSFGSSPAVGLGVDGDPGRGTVFVYVGGESVVCLWDLHVWSSSSMNGVRVVKRMSQYR